MSIILIIKNHHHHSYSCHRYLESHTNRGHVEKSSNNHFMFWKTTGKKQVTNFVPPTKFVDMKFHDWLKLAYSADQNKLDKNAEHYYYMMNSDPHNNDGNFISDDLQIFSTKKENFFITNVPANKGIQCRFSMRGIIAEAHYDSGRNMVAMFKGAKRYILTPPSTCDKLGIIGDPSHPSYRHSAIDWSNIEEARSHDFGNIPAIDTIVREGEILYIPSYWFHYIISLQYSVQCNSRSGTPPNEIGELDIDKCFEDEIQPGKKKKKKLGGIAPLLNGG